MLSGCDIRLNIYYLRQDGIKQWHALRCDCDMISNAHDKAKLRDFVDCIDVEQVGGSDARALRQAAKVNPFRQPQSHQQAFGGAR
jgi:uncharacterized protein YdaU (DUF1376 family)